MKLAIMQPYVFPYIGYFQLINAVDKFVILDDVNLIIRGWINRNRILVNGHNHLFSVPIKKASQNKLIYECELAAGNWNVKLLKTIETSYSKAPYYNNCFGIISSTICAEETNLSKWLFQQIKMVCSYLEIKTEIIDSSRFYNNQNLKAQDKIIDICKKENADSYYNAIGGEALYNVDDFKSQHIELHFIKSKTECYHQFNFDFVPFLSIIDVMMFNSKSEIQKQLLKYELI